MTPADKKYLRRLEDKTRGFYNENTTHLKDKTMENNYSFIQYTERMYLPNGVYNGRYNKEPSVIRIEKGKPVYVSFIGFIKDGESKSSAIFDAKGIMISSVEILLAAQKFSIYDKMSKM